MVTRKYNTVAIVFFFSVAPDIKIFTKYVEHVLKC